MRNKLSLLWTAPCQTKGPSITVRRDLMHQFLKTTAQLKQRVAFVANFKYWYIVRRGVVAHLSGREMDFQRKLI